MHCDDLIALLMCELAEPSAIGLRETIVRLRQLRGLLMKVLQGKCYLACAVEPEMAVSAQGIRVGRGRA